MFSDENVITILLMLYGPLMMTKSKVIFFLIYPMIEIDSLIIDVPILYSHLHVLRLSPRYYNVLVLILFDY